MNTSSSRLVRDLMTTNVVTLGRTDSLRSVDDLMRVQRIRHMPIVDEDGSLVGIVSQRDLFHGGLLRALGYGSHAREQALEGLMTKEAMKTEVITTSGDTPLAEAAKLMLERQIGCLVVLENQKIVGILTEADFVRLAVSN
ncbi:MAG TPA: CBS domain-containing protein [Polyangiaceae bacterium]